MKKTNRTKKTIGSLVGGIILCLFLVNPILAANTAVFSVSCYMPYYVTTADGEQVSADSQTGQETVIAQEQKTEEIIAEESVVFVEQRERITSKDSGEAELINTVCAK